MTEEGPSPLERIRAIERRLVWDAISTTVASVSVAVLLFVAYAVGHSLGPVKMRSIEAVLGLSGMTLVALGVARPLTQRQRQRRARGSYTLSEGQSRRRALVFDDYVLLDQEVVLAATVERVERTESGLVVRYVDPVASGPLLREWAGSSQALDAVADALRPVSAA